MARILISMPDEFLDKVLNGGLYLKQGIKYYLKKESELFIETQNNIDTTENDADTLRRTIETKLYSHTLIIIRFVRFIAGLYLTAITTIVVD